ncbi:hypothetical protein [Flavobacterium sp. UGB4466]|uniref:hypothetical protein n=1 Tax=Flavobacterium sp. UGB4466 TaxID=2730889 RepID=UPI00192CC30F|nr:hypothetical protein [Flavobacterium sp. UGB4466]
MKKNVQRIGVGNRIFPSVDENIGINEPGVFTFDSTTVSCDSIVDTFDFDIVVVPPVEKRDYSNKDYSETDYK